MLQLALISISTLTFAFYFLSSLWLVSFGTQLWQVLVVFHVEFTAGNDQEHQTEGKGGERCGAGGADFYIWKKEWKY